MSQITYPKGTCEGGVCEFNPWQANGGDWTITAGTTVNGQLPTGTITESFANGNLFYNYQRGDSVTNQTESPAIWIVGTDPSSSSSLTLTVTLENLWDPDTQKVYGAGITPVFSQVQGNNRARDSLLTVYGFYDGIESDSSDKRTIGSYVINTIDDYPGNSFSAFPDEGYGANLTINLEENAQAYLRVYGGRNDMFRYTNSSELGGNFKAVTGFNPENVVEGSGKSNNNVVTFNIKPGAQLTLRHFIAGRSTDALANVFYGFETNYNQAIINYLPKEGSSYKVPMTLTADDYDQINVHLGAGIFGAEGLIAYRNVVQVNNAIVTNDLEGTRKMGIVGGKGWLTYFISEDAATFNNNLAFNGNTVNSGWAQGNIVVIKNSNIDYFDDTEGTGIQTEQNPDGNGIPRGFYQSSSTSDGISIYGGYSTGSTNNNIVIVENSYVDGNIYGALKFDNKIAPTRTDALTAPFSNDYVSLHNVHLTSDSAVYGAARGWSDGVSGNSNFESGTRVINSRSGKVFISGQNYAGSIYAREVEFGSHYVYVDGAPYEQSVQLAPADDPIQLGQLIGGSSITTASGFHSSLAVQTDGSEWIHANGVSGDAPPDTTTGGDGWVYGSTNQVYFQSEGEGGQNINQVDHNFWRAVTVQLSSTVNGDGHLNNDATTWSENEETGDYTLQYTTATEGNSTLSLLGHDDGRMVLLGVSPGGGPDSKAVTLYWNEIGEYRNDINEALQAKVKSGEMTAEDAMALAFTGAQLQGYTLVNVIVDGNTANAQSNNGAFKTYADTQNNALTFENSFTIYQTPLGSGENQQPIPVATATYQISNVLWAYTDNDNESNDQTSPWSVTTNPDGSINPNATVTVGQNEGEPGQPGGIGIRYRLIRLNVLPGQQLILYGRNQVDSNESEYWTTPPQENSKGWRLPTTVVGNDAEQKSNEQNLFTLTAQVTGSGGIIVPQNNVVIIGGTSYMSTSSVGNNTYTGRTTIYPNAYLFVNEDTALGETNYLQLMDANPENVMAETNPMFTSNSPYKDILVEQMQTLGGQLFLNGHNCQNVGSLYVGKGAIVTFDRLQGLTNHEEAQNADEDTSPMLTVTATLPNSGVAAYNLFGDASGAIIRGHLRSSIQEDPNGNPLYPRLLLQGSRLEVYSSNLNTEAANAADQAAGNAATPAPQTPAEGDSYYFNGRIILSNYSDAYFYNTTAMAGPDTTVRLLPASEDNPTGTRNSLTFMSGRLVGGQSLVNYIGNLQNAGDVHVSPQGITSFDQMNNVVVQNNFIGENGGVLWFNTELASDDANTDLVTVMGTATGSNLVAVQNMNGEGAQTQYGILIMKVMGDAENNQLTLSMDPRYPAAAGAWYYTLEKKPLIVTAADGTPILDAEGQFQILEGEGAGTGFFLVNDHNIRSEAGAYVDNSMAWSKMHMRLHDRMGQAYYKDPFTGEIKEYAGWVREVGEHTHFRMHGGDVHAHFSTTLTQFGLDFIRKNVDDDKPDGWKYNLGVLAGGLYSKGKARSLYTTRSKVRGAAVGLYGTLYEHNTPDDPSGLYVDTWVMWNYFKNDIYDPFPQFHYHAKGFAASIEAGYTFKFAESDVKEWDGTPSEDRANWLIQPQAQIIWDGVRADSARDSQDTVYKQLGKNNFVTRLGARMMVDRAKKGIGFIEGNWIHNMRKRGVAMDGYNVYQDGARDSGEVRIGVEGHLSENLLGWFNAGLRVGTKGYHDEMVAIGIKYMF